MEEQLKLSLKQMRIMITSTMIAVLGVSVYSFGISFYILSSTGSAKLFSINLALGILGRIISTFFSGYVADHFNRKRVLFYCIVLESLIVFALLIYIHFFGFNILALYITTFLAAFISSLSNPSMLAAMPNIIHSEHMQKAMGYNSTASSLSMLLGPVIGGFLYGFVSKEVFLLMFVIAYLIAGLLILLLDFELFKQPGKQLSVENDGEKENVLQSFIYGLKYIWHHKVIRSLLLLFMSLNFFMSTLNIGMSKIIVGHFQASSQMMGFLEASFSIGLLVGGIVIAKMKKITNPFPVLKKGLVIEALLLIIISVPLLLIDSLMPVYITFMIVGLILGIIVTFINTPMMIFFQEKTEEHMRGRIFSVIFLMSQLLMPISYVFFGFIFDLGYYGWIYLLCGSLSLLITLLVMNRQFNERVKIYS